MRRWLPGIVVVAPALLVVFVALKTMGEPVRPDDLWWHLGMGRSLVERAAIPSVDAFSFTQRGAPYFDQPWLAQAALFEMHRTFGLAGLLVLDFLVTLATAFVVVISTRARGAGLIASAIAQVALTPVAARGWSLRPQIFAVSIFALFVLVLSSVRGDRSRRRWLFVLPPLAALWANVHGSFPLACVLVVAFAAAIVADDRTRWRDAPLLGVVAALTLVAPIANPRGTAIFGYVGSLLASAPVHEVAPEWRPVGLDNLEGIYIATVLLVAFILLGRRRALGDVILVAPFAALELAAIRNGIWLALVLAPIAATWVPIDPGERIARVAWRGAIAVAAIALAIPWFKPRVLGPPYGPLVLESRTPIRAVTALAGDPVPPQHLFHDVGAGSYLISTLPSQPVFIDARLELYPASQWRDLTTARAGQDVARIFSTYAIDGALLEKRGSPALVAVVRRDPTFTLRYEDEDYVYFAR